jgi:hypothetical protein
MPGALRTRSPGPGPAKIGRKTPMFAGERQKSWFVGS